MERKVSDVGIFQQAVVVILESFLLKIMTELVGNDEAVIGVLIPCPPLVLCLLLFPTGKLGCHAETPHIEPALVPQDCGLHMDTQQVCLQLANGKTLTIEQTGEAFAFSALPKTAQQIEAAQHLCELPETGRTSITVLGAARGVGGIDSWGTDVEEPCRLSGECDRSVSFRIVL